MKSFIFVLLMLSQSAHGTIYIFTPGKPAQVINKNADGYTITEMDSGVTQVLNLNGMSVIYGGGRPTSFIMDGGKGAQEMQGPIPAVNPFDGEVNPVVPIEYMQ